MLDESSRSSVAAASPAESYPLLDALLHRRSRRFGPGMRLNGGPLAYQSTHQPQPLTLDEEAALAFAACGITGPILAELPFESGDLPEAGSGNIITHLIGRTVPSGDAMHTVVLFVLDDEGAWMLKRPQDYPREEIGLLAQAAREGRLVELYEQSRVRLADRRLDVPRAQPFVPPFNKWAANQPGTTYFLPVNELSALYINLLLAAFGAEFASFIFDDRNRFRPAGIAKFGRSRGGHLHDNPNLGRVGTVTGTEAWLFEFTAFEQGAMLQNLALMVEALGLGGFVHFAAYPYIWMQTLGFRMEQPRFSRTVGARPLAAQLLKALRRDPVVPTAVGLEHNGDVLIKPFCPPYYRNMEAAVLAYVEYKFDPQRGTLRVGGAETSWQDGASIQAAIPRPSDRAIAATIAYCDYLYKRYGRFPATNGPFRTVLAYQAHHLDMEFYDRFYKPEAVGERQRRHAEPTNDH